ncbi:hypothetical protein OIU78_006219 [Salix suchowensis]|nr:hypothetical protein OIU78_006219 [Salix suchowensis]
MYLSRSPPKRSPRSPAPPNLEREDNKPPPPPRPPAEGQSLAQCPERPHLKHSSCPAGLSPPP